MWCSIIYTTADYFIKYLSCHFKSLSSPLLHTFLFLKRCTALYQPVCSMFCCQWETPNSQWFQNMDHYTFPAHPSSYPWLVMIRITVMALKNPMLLKAVHHVYTTITWEPSLPPSQMLFYHQPLMSIFTMTFPLPPMKLLLQKLIGIRSISIYPRAYNGPSTRQSARYTR